MKRVIVVVLAAVLCSTASAQRNNWKPKDFQPLTELPWRGSSLPPMEKLVERIFRETNSEIRYSVLGKYLHDIPVADMGRAFDKCVSLEGTQSPDSLVEFLLYIWAKRDPAAAWERTKGLFEVVGVENGWLGYDSWDEEIEVESAVAIQRSPFWLGRGTLTSFASGCDASSLPDDQRVKLLKAFADLWFERFASWPGGSSTTSYPGAVEYSGAKILQAFSDGLANLSSYADEPAGCEVIWRSTLAAQPERAAEVIRSIEATEFRSEQWPVPREASHASISAELLLVWYRADLAGLKEWASSPQKEMHREAVNTARCLLMHDVGPKVRQTWLTELLNGEKGRNNLELLASWEPKLAMESAAMVNPEKFDLQSIVDGCAYGPWWGQPWNGTHAGMGYLFDHGLDHLSAPLRKQFIEVWFECTALEQWGDLDVGETARFGLRTMLKDNLVPRHDLIEMYRGRKDGDRDDGLVDRTFCAMRTWAVVRPDEMREWIKTQPGEDLRVALTWLLEHPWGGKKHKP